MIDVFCDEDFRRVFWGAELMLIIDLMRDPLFHDADVCACSFFICFVT